MGYEGLGIAAQASSSDASVTFAAVTWVQIDPTNSFPEIGVATNADMTNLSGWVANLPIVSNESGSVISVDQAGNAVVVWPNNAGSNPFIQGATYTLGGSWSALETVSNESATTFSAVNPQVSAYGNGNAMAIWNIFVDSTNQVQTALFPASSSSAPSPPSSLKGSHKANQFAGCVEYFNSLYWTASPSEVVSYQIYRNGVLIATVPSTQFSYQDHNQPKGPVTYEVRAVNASQSQSEPQTIVL